MVGFLLYGECPDSDVTYVLILPIVLAALLAHVLIVIICKWLILGRQRPGVRVVYSWPFVRWWVVYKIMQSFPLQITNSLLRETPLLVWFYRGLGAKLGRNVVLSGNTFGNIMLDFDLIEIGDGSFIDQVFCSLAIRE